MICSTAAGETGDSKEAVGFSIVPWLFGEFASADDGETGVMRTTRGLLGLDAAAAAAAHSLCTKFGIEVEDCQSEGEGEAMLAGSCEKLVESINMPEDEPGVDGSMALRFVRPSQLRRTL